MGCHTWTYKKASSLTEEEKKHFVDKEIKDLENWWGFNETHKKVILTVEKWFKDGLISKDISPTQYALDMIQEYKNKLNDYRENGFDAYIRYHKNRCGAEMKTYNGELYVNIDFDVPCRVYGYHEEKFTDVDMFIDWLNNIDETFGYYNDSDEFVEGFSDKLEKIVRAYFEKHGKENLLIEFG